MTITNASSLHYYQGALNGAKWFDGLLADIRPDADANGAMLDAALHYTVSKEPLYTSGPGSDEPSRSVRHRAVWTHDLLTGRSQFAEAIVGEDYEPIQNQPIVEAMYQLKDSGMVDWKLGGTLNGGMRCFLHGTIGEQFEIDGDPHVKGILASWSHDGSSTLRVTPFVTRLWCANQIPSMFGRARRGGVVIRHTKSAGIKMETLAGSVASALLQVEEYEQVMVRLLSIQGITKQGVEDYIAKIVPIPDALIQTPDHLLTTGQKRSLTMAQNKRAAIREIYWSSETQENLRGTAAGLFHAVVEASDHRFSGNRGVRQLTGTDVALKVEALEYALAA